MARKVGWKKGTSPLQIVFRHHQYRHSSILEIGQRSVDPYGTGKKTGHVVFRIDDSATDAITLDAMKARRVALAILDRCNEIEGVK